MAKPYKIIFLDFDGPMIPGRCCFMPENYRKLMTVFDPVASAFLNLVLKKDKDIRIVISSTWGLKGLEIIKENFRKNGLPASRLHKDWITPRQLTSYRHNEINWWLQDHPEVTEYIVIDDEISDEYFPGRLINADTYDGLSWKHYMQISRIFNLGFHDN